MEFDCIVGHMQVDHGRVVHHMSIVIACEYVSSAPHVSCQLISLVEGPVQNTAPALFQPEISNHEIICSGRAKFRMFEVNAADPVSLPLEAGNKVTPNETTGSAN
jgi:hypothetical protein